MIVKCKRIAKNIYHIILPSKWQLAKTFLRFQEYSESPKFRGKIFSLDEFKKWYVSNSPRGKKTGKFTYYRDWDGFNIPSKTLEPFYRGKFNPLSEEEKEILALFKNKRKQKLYIIATYNNSSKHLIKHETAHGLFYTNPKYKRDVINILENIDRGAKRGIIHYLSEYGGGYYQGVWADEIHAYTLSDFNYLKKHGVNTRKLVKTNRDLNAVFNKYSKS